ncbi:hypothetical protein A2982_00410 [candidate division WWE3 bacterium RIFCSPLOWO2_01_FULL_39_13]|uniref:Uncharacterized protein n=1 Tax=candidate division WWE3 bacterium RIFCSPLOWO2_01_FULL_39_13 TaxID=1802624 RepID=A0A1F4V501_UNCKA|nr:MAG: hypothetical protein A2982_00410 [candidate division WWE3 bacterium RIFCSPLOWO2_01_FULL_39_13]
MKKILASLVIIAMAVVSLFQATSAVFEESVRVAGTSFTVGTSAEDNTAGNTALKFLLNVSGSTESSNLTDTVAGPVLDNIDSIWSDVILLKLYNKGTTPLNVVSKAEYINDPNTLRDDIFVKAVAWNDANNNGVLDSGEEGVSYGYDTILRWRNDTFPVGLLGSGEVKGVALKFDGTGVTDSNIGQSAVYDFVFTGVEE